MTKELKAAIFALSVIWDACANGSGPCLALLRLLDPERTPDGIWREAAAHINGLTEAAIMERLTGHEKDGN